MSGARQLLNLTAVSPAQSRTEIQHRDGKPRKCQCKKEPRTTGSNDRGNDRAANSLFSLR